MLRDALRVAGVGTGAGLIGAIALLFVALIAAYIPAHRATKIDPVEALRAE